MSSYVTEPSSEGAVRGSAVLPMQLPPQEATLEAVLARAEGGRAWARRIAIWVGIVAAISGVVVWRVRTRPPPAPRYMVSRLSRGDVIESVQSTGTLQPLTQVQVGAQISGRIARVYVDYNSEVHRGDVLAEIDPTLLGATVEQNRAQLASAEAQLARSQAALATAEAALARVERLRAESLASQADVDQAKGQRDVSVADVAAAQAQIVQTKAQLAYSKTNYQYSRIYAPIDGLVISRNIDPGQTVAASFQAPTLFVIAQDMRKMRILAEVDEADVGKLKEGMAAEATVDAFAGETFHGKVNQLRYSPNTVQGVVTYLAVLDVDNPELKLRPGMTATVTMKTREAKDAVRVPNAALRFRPSKRDGPEGRAPAITGEAPLGVGKGRIYVVVDPSPGVERIEPKVLDIGITDGTATQVRSKDVDPDLEVVVDETDQDEKKKGPRIF